MSGFTSGYVPPWVISWLRDFARDSLMSVGAKAELQEFLAAAAEESKNKSVIYAQRILDPETNDLLGWLVRTATIDWSRAATSEETTYDRQLRTKGRVSCEWPVSQPLV